MSGPSISFLSEAHSHPYSNSRLIELSLGSITCRHFSSHPASLSLSIFSTSVAPFSLKVDPIPSSSLHASSPSHKLEPVLALDISTMGRGYDSCMYEKQARHDGGLGVQRYCQRRGRCHTVAKIKQPPPPSPKSWSPTTTWWHPRSMSSTQATGHPHFIGLPI